MARLPQPGGDSGNWGDILNDFLSQSLTSGGAVKPGIIDTTQLASNSVTSAKLAPGSVDNAAVATGAVSETQLSSAVQTKLNQPATITDGSITKDKLVTSVQTSLDKADSALQTAPVTSVNTRTGAITLTKTDVGLGSVDNTADTAKPVSTAQQSALDLKGDASALAAKLNTADLDTSVAGKVTDTASATSTALTAAFAGGTKYASRTAVDALAGIKRSLDDGTRSTAIQVMSDSTANDTNDWPYLLAQKIAADYPNWTVRWQSWDDTNQRFPAPTIIQTGTAGPLYLDGSTGANALRLDASVCPYIGAALDVRVKLDLGATWDVGQVLVSKNGGAGQRAWYLSMTTTGSGRPSLTYSVDGTALITAACNATPVPAVGSPSWIRVTYQGDNGAGGTDVKFYTSTDGVVWTQLGSTVTTAGTSTLFNNSATGIALGGNTATLAGSKFYEVQVRDGIDGPNKVPALPDLWPPITSPDANAHVVGAPTLTIINGGKAGGDIAYLIDPTRLPKLMPNFGQAVTFLSQSHNMGTQFGEQWYATFKNFADTVQPIRIAAPMVVLNENPEKGAAVNKEWHAQRARELPAIARRLSLGCIDTFQMFTDTPTYTTAMMLDDVHPNATGSGVWADLIYAAIKAAT